MHFVSNLPFRHCFQLYNHACNFPAGPLGSGSLECRLCDWPRSARSVGSWGVVHSDRSVDIHAMRLKTVLICVTSFCIWIGLAGCPQPCKAIAANCYTAACDCRQLVGPARSVCGGRHSALWLQPSPAAQAAQEARCTPVKVEGASFWLTLVT